MDKEIGDKTLVGFNSNPAQKRKDWILLVLRLVAFFATASATIVMAVNKETKTMVVATIGNNQVKATLSAKFQHTPAFVLVFWFFAVHICAMHCFQIIDIKDIFEC